MSQRRIEWTGISRWSLRYRRNQSFHDVIFAFGSVHAHVKREDAGRQDENDPEGDRECGEDPVKVYKGDTLRQGDPFIE